MPRFLPSGWIYVGEKNYDGIIVKKYSNFQNHIIEISNLTLAEVEFAKLRLENYFLEHNMEIQIIQNDINKIMLISFCNTS